jgi:hypothetical protein
MIDSVLLLGPLNSALIDGPLEEPFNPNFTPSRLQPEIQQIQAIMRRDPAYLVVVFR